MTKPKLSKIELQGFRSFGTVRQSIDLPDSVSVLWGGNSQGKTSLVEALEFLFTGQIARRDLLASAKDEFAEALRNVHIAPSHPVWVEAKIICSDGVTRTLTRRLLEDYKRGSTAGCASRLEIDGQVCTEQNLEDKLGLRLSHPPLRAPVLAQHTLGYLFSASPTDRAAYFRAVLDTQDLEDFRLAVAALQPLLKAPALPSLDDLAALEAMPALAATVGRIRKAKNEADLRKALLASSSALLKSIEITPKATLADQADQIDSELQRRRTLAFPLHLFSRTPLAPWTGAGPGPSSAIETFLVERAKVDAETRRLVDLFKAALSLTTHPGEHQPIDCPLCAATNTFTADRVALIREKVAATESYTTSASNFDTSLRNAESELGTLALAADRALPKFMHETAANRRSAGFTVAGIRRLLPDEPVISSWLATVLPLWRAARALRQNIRAACAALQTAIADPEQWNGARALAESLVLIGEAHVRLDASLSVYDAPAKGLGPALKAAVDQSAATNGWEGLVRLSRDPTGLWSALMALTDHAVKLKTLEKAIAEIDAGNGKVLDEKFVNLSEGVRHWWNCLRPDEPTYFDAVQRRGTKTRRTIDLKVGLSAKDDRSDPKIRDAVAVFSHSQLHCLGLALFLAKAIQEGLGFVVLDDPVLTSDDDYRPNFVSSVIESLLDAGLQVIICTQDHKSWKDIGDRWGHRGAAQFQLIRNDAILGTEIRSQNDDLATMMAKAQPLLKSQDPAVRKDGAIRLREAIERFAKMIIVRDRQAKGDTLASITDYDGKNFAAYAQQAMGLLTKDRSHPGKLKGAHNYATPGPHDDKPPSAGELASAYGDLKRLKKDYLD